MHRQIKRTALEERLFELLAQVLSPTDWVQLIPCLDTLWSGALEQVQEDLQAYAERDPASNGRAEVILDTYASFKAILFHRFAHPIWHNPDIADHENIAQRLANAGKLQSGAEIHPAASIGRRFVLDHGYGTVIGETCEIGDDCYLLSGVTLGASGIADNGSGKRHPTLGNQVEIGAGARLLGPISIGDSVFISPACVITRDVPAHCRISVANQLQLQRDGSLPSRGYLGAFAADGYVHLVGELPPSCALELVDADHRPLDWLELRQDSACRHHAQFSLRRSKGTELDSRLPINLHLAGAGQDVTLIDPPGLAQLICKLAQTQEPLLEAAPLLLPG
ncbi:serine O-acetyltransferase [Pseudomonas nitritireducens]|uniref:serine O-acetyltransferase n=1 Tax=Pseudomonas nitroreducens TaxID=46680 RepID=A0A7W7KGS9_PSENT|nr:serine O-acetyltransferase [Pseudomonas nitritireducens]MBB4862570.1 serine O-acetyltransferase [Pseudomonas nitritireducens]